MLNMYITLLNHLIFSVTKHSMLRLFEKCKCSTTTKNLVWSDYKTTNFNLTCQSLYDDIDCNVNKGLHITKCPCYWCYLIKINQYVLDITYFLY